MSKNDYFGIAHRILKYLYICHKNGDLVDPEMLKYNSPVVKAGDSNKWCQVLNQMYEKGLIKGICMCPIDGLAFRVPLSLEQCYITAEGIKDYHLNSRLKKVLRGIKELEDVLPVQ